MENVASAIRAALLTGEPSAKWFAARDVARRWRRGKLTPVFDCEMPDLPARPERPELLAPGQMPKARQIRIGAWPHRSVA